jgi:poly(A) polymerase
VAAFFSLPDHWPVPRLPLQGADIVSRGVAPGPRVGEILRRFEEWWIRMGFPEDHALLELEVDRLIQDVRA